MGVFASVLIKKRRYWPRDINGEAISSYFGNKGVGHSDAWPGEIDGVRFHIFCMKEPDYVMSLMSTYGTTSPKVDQRETNRHYSLYPTQSAPRGQLALLHGHAERLRALQLHEAQLALAARAQHAQRYVQVAGAAAL